MIKVLSFDILNTVFDTSKVPKEEMRAYGEHIRRHNKPYKPLVLPQSWEWLLAFPDSKEGLDKLRKSFTVVTCSNAPANLQVKLSKHNDIVWDAIVPLQLKEVFKPNLLAYQTIAEMFNCKPSEIMMVTANKNFGDLESAFSLGMRDMLIRHEDAQFKTIIELANHMEAYKKKVQNHE